MKPVHLILAAFVTTPVVAPLVAAVADDASGSFSTETLLAALPSSPDRLWVQVKAPVTIEELSSQLRVDETRLARLNQVDEDHQFSRGDWLAVPPQQSQRLGVIASVDASEIRRMPPSQEPASTGSAGVVHLGDTLLKIAQRYGLTITELLRLNPGLETARLVVGTQIRLAQSSPARSRMVLGLNPVGSGGLSWPELPQFGGEPQRPVEGTTTADGWIWPTKGVFTSGYGWRWGRMHKGIDVANNVGTSVVAAKAGEVVFSGWDDGGYGYLVRIRHDDGSVSLYAHNSRLLVQSGERVAQGQPISQMGNTGRSTGPHLHFEIHPTGRGASNPLQFLPPRA